MSEEVWVAGIGTTKWGVSQNIESYELGAQAIIEAIRDSELGWDEVQAIYCGSVYQGTGSGHRVVQELGFNGVPIINVENACSSGATAFQLAYQSVKSGEYDVALAFGYEKMPRGPIPSTAFPKWQLEMGFNVQPANYSLETIEYMKEYGATEEDFALVSVKNRKNGSLNPNARFQKTVTIEEVLNSRIIATPLRLLNCCPLADGATASVLVNKNRLKNKRKGIEVVCSVLTSGVYGEAIYQSGIVPSVKYSPEEGLVELSARKAYETSGYGPGDMDIVQAYDSMSPGELWDIEKLGFCERGLAPQLLREGYFDLDGKLPVNTDGGLLSRGHPLGATGLAQIYEVVQQLRGYAGERQVDNPRMGLTHAMGAGPNSTITILKK
ncbi:MULTISPECIES: thiolase family protein [Sporosarcina]|uniref:thiolase family protein n=1 Tax=Sporosarcina TaxID=1569 RepID=UPI000A14951A|nr:MULTISPECIES: thiolase family protein [Sporosarcina]ARJ39584.1 hypothetical protein SporoP8_12290 [Sporosarcina ureae]PIC68001.1 propanoyl-CoA acyltransferase [Sporosarcina sp. P16a]PIC83098.1 propanoyl-CoA acyltransferase [Sporosarcina sp. P1]PIC90918.1 propanoyl-CoA acyltransferase [Sporosarcina sp. P21c]PIC94310.1 propanoyl-CoA acyltransferase [Sporosarcina sp. P25]